MPRTGTGILATFAPVTDLTHYPLGDIVEVCADLRTSRRSSTRRDAHPHRVDDDSTLLFRLASGARTMSLTARLRSPDFPVGRRHYQVNGTRVASP
jgi:hypothetical protein